MTRFYFDKTLRLTSGAGKSFPVSRQNKFIAGLFALCAVLWILAAIHPLDRQAWALKNILLVLFVLALVFSRRHLHFSNASYIFIALFIILHIIRVHYTYAKMPLGLWARDFFGFSRNHLDRVAHFGFGFCLAFPVRELLLRFSGHGAFGCRPRSFSRSAVFSKFWKASSRRSSRPGKVSTGRRTGRRIAAFLGAILMASLLNLRQQATSRARS
jgi:hypothetical protein